MRYSCFAARSVLPLVALAGLVERAPAQTVTGPAIPVPPGRGAFDKHSVARVFVVDDAGCRFTRHVQVAVDAANDGDVIVIRPGSYGPFVIDGKAVHVFAEAGPSGTDVRVEGFEVRNLAADQGVVVRGLYSPAHPILVEVNAGPVWIERCIAGYPASFDDSSIVGLYGSAFAPPQFAPPNAAAYVTDDTTLLSYRSAFRGWDGYDGSCEDFGYCYPCYPSHASDGGTAVQLRGPARGFFFGSSLYGGRGGDGRWSDCCGLWSCYSFDGLDGHGLYLGSGSEAVLIDTTAHLTGGSGGVVSTLPGTIGGYSVTSPVESGVPATLTFTGPAGWNVLLTYSYRHRPEFDPTTNCWSVVSPDSPTLFIGALPLSGTLQVALPFHLPPAERAAVIYTQAKLYDTLTGNGFLAEPSALLVYRDPCP
jgi:hypothetical protein